jgi:putative Ca2+/H+ antiporter (TMEM165/GDT1 family)
MTSHFQNVKLKIFTKLILFIFLINSCMGLRLIQKETQSINKNEITLTKENRSIFKILESISTIFLSGLFDRSFFITTLLAIKYSKCLVIVAATAALSTVGMISVLLGITITKYIDMMWVDFFSIFLFLIFGIKMIAEGFKMSENDDAMRLEDGNHLNMAEEEKLVNIKSDTADAELNNIKKTNHFIVSFQIFVNVFIFVFASEIGDRSQISTIYLSSNFDKMTVLISVVIGQFLITVLAVFGGIFIAQRISSKNLTIIAGSTFVLFGIFALFLLCFESNFVTGFNQKASTANHMDDIKAFKIKNNLNQIGLIPEKEKPTIS